MNFMGILVVLLILGNALASYQGFRDRAFFEKYLFRIERIRLYKEYYRLVSSSFLHVGWMHLIFNMIVLYSFAGQVDHQFGAVGFLLLYFSSVLGGNLITLALRKNQSDYSAVGASGGVIGIVFSAIALFPGLKMQFLFLPFFSMPAWLLGAGYLIYTIFGIRNQWGNIGHEAHLGGVITGLLLTVLVFPSTLQSQPLVIISMLILAGGFLYLVLTYPEMLLIDNFWRKRFSKAVRPNKKGPVNREQELNALLEKVNKVGYEKLSQQEKDRLKDLSNKI